MKLKPDIYVKTVYDIDYKQLQNKNIKILCFDLDNTLSEPDVINTKKDPKMEELLNNLREDFEVMIVSNNTIKNRVKSFADLYDLDYIESMHKPFQKKYQNEKIIKYDKSEVMFIGDKLITDILGARLFGSPSILVDPLYPKKNIWYNQLMYFIDNIFSVFTGVKKHKYFNEF